jgi:hypothetical protein
MMQSTPALEQGSLNSPPKKPMNRLVVLRKEFMDLTQDPLIAIVLNQLVYWSRRVNDYSYYLREEKEDEPNPQFGWIYKSAEELIEETMIGVDRSTMCRYLTFLLDNEWILRRLNPHNKWDKIPQYRVNRRKLESDLLKLEHSLPGEQNPTVQNATSSVQNATSSVQNAPSTVQIAPSYTYTETTNKEYRQKEEASALTQKMMEVWKNHMPYDQPGLTESRIQQMETLLKREFHDDIEEWGRFCERVKECPFLMGQGAKGWRIRLDWLLFPNNFQKVQEGQYDDYDRPITPLSHPAQNPKIAEILETIKDPIWKEWCTKMANGLSLPNGHMVENRLSIRDLNAIKHAWFLEYDDDFLVWIGSDNQRVLDRIDDLRLKINWAFKEDYAEGRSFRTRLVER